MNTSRIVLTQERVGVDHFAGVREAIQARAGGCARAERALPDEPLRLGPGDVLCVSDTRSFAAKYALRQARKAGACCALLMDGIVEYRNTFGNPRSGANFLRPAPVDVIACAGVNDARLLRELGNEAVATGLPRLGGIEASPLPESPRALVATALRPYFDERERAALVAGLQRVGDVLGELGIAVDWRLTGGLEEAIGVQHDPELPLGALLGRASFVIASPSTLLVEAMLAGRPTGVLFPFKAPRWPQAPVVIDSGALADPRTLRAAIAELAASGAALQARHAEVLREMHGAPDGRAPAEALADLLIELAERPRRRAIDPTLLDPRRLPALLPRKRGKTRVVSLVHCVESPVGGVTVWSRRLARALAARKSRYDMRTLLVVTHPDSLPERFTDDAGLTHTCVVDPMADRWEALETVRAAIERLGADIVLPNYADVCYAAATLARAHGARVVPIAHTDHASYRELIAFYDRWAAAAGVSDACMEWLAPLAEGMSPQRHRGHREGVGLGGELKSGGRVDGASAPRDGGGTHVPLRGGRRPVRKIVYGVPLARAPREVSVAGPLRIAYIGRMVEAQKRIGDLLRVIDGLEHRGVSYELHMVGDGGDFAAWRARLAQRTLRSGRVILHGRQTPEQVQDLLQRIDVSILVSDYEGTSITMLEAMGAGVIPAVTRVPSGVSEWVRDGENGVVVDIGDTEAMAVRLAALAADRGEVARLGRRAWETVRSTVSIDRMAEQYEELFDAAMALPRDLRPTDRGLRFIEEWTCRKSWSDDPAGARAWIAQTLETQGYERICLGWPLGAGWPDAPRRESAPPRVEGPPALDAAILPDGDSRTESLRARGIGVACSPSLHEHALRRAVRCAAAAGAERIAIYGMGLHTRRCAGIFLENLPIVGIIDDDPPAWGTAFGLPVTTAERAMAELRPNCIMLSSDRCEQAMWERTAPMRAAGVKVIALYGGDQAPTPPERTVAAT